MAEVEQMPDDLMSKSQDSSVDGSVKMSMSESDRSLEASHQSLDDSHQEPNRAVIFMKHEASEASDGDFDDHLGDFDDDSDSLPVVSGDKFNRNYFTMTYTDTESCLEDGLNNNEGDEDWLNTSLSHDENDNLEEEEEDTQNTTLVASTSAKKSLMKLFSPDKLPLRKLQMETDQEKLSPMDVSDISSPDSHKSISEELTVSMTSSAFSLSEDSLTYIVRASGAKDEVREVREEEDSLDEISSGEISEEERGVESEDRQSNVSQNLSELWDDVSY